MIPLGRKLSRQGESGPAKASIILDFPRNSNEYSFKWKDEFAAKASHDGSSQSLNSEALTRMHKCAFLNVSTISEPYFAFSQMKTRNFLSFSSLMQILFHSILCRADKRMFHHHKRLSIFSVRIPFYGIEIKFQKGKGTARSPHQVATLLKIKMTLNYSSLADGIR